MKILSSLALIFTCFNFLSFAALAQDDMMDDGYSSEMSEPAPMDEMPAPSQYEDEAPMPSEFPEGAGDGQWEDSAPSTPTDAMKDFNHSQDERMDELDSYEEDY